MTRQEEKIYMEQLREKRIKEGLEKFLNDCESDADYVYELQNINKIDLVDDLDNFLDNLLENCQNWIYEQDIIYHYNAIEYLKENDASLQESLEIASEYGLSLEGLSSETLATLLYQRKQSELLYEDIELLRGIFEDIIDELEDAMQVVSIENKGRFIAVSLYNNDDKSFSFEKFQGYSVNEVRNILKGRGYTII